ncbi:uncharacterized protein LOC117808774 isoform X2 [Notolabrus celidotus]|uniref:uncharacterized protein LOC117808774 isoform X2 n=1 Tax=Notolabrus celidotus TaxID=1203425 RepID=UPI00148F7645|nr:uncharacterized protein LOC117808774 isoform X2 [Notolabrus celidotus]
MAAPVSVGLILLLGLCSGSGPDSERGRMELRRVRSLAAQPRYGECWARALDHLDTRCRDLTSESQSWIALSFTLCHLSSSGRDIPACPEGSEVSRCTGAMDAVAFNAYTEFFTHTHSMCHFLQSEAWQSRAETTMHRLTETSAGVAEQLESTRQMAEDLIDAQSAALQAQQEILNNGEELRVTLTDSTQELPADGGSQSELLLLQRCCSLHRLPAYLHPAVLQSQELVSVYVSVCRRVMVCVGVCVLLCVCVRYRDPVQQSLQVLRETQKSLQEALQHAEGLGERHRRTPSDVKRRSQSRRGREEEKKMKDIKREEEEEEESTLLCLNTDSSDLSHLSLTGQCPSHCSVTN